MGELRHLMRHQSFLRGLVYFNGSSEPADCLIRDVSAHCARIILCHAMTVPGSVELYIPHLDRTERAYVEWRRGSELSLRFSEAIYIHSASLETNNLAQRIAQLEFELASLRQAVKRLRAKTRS
jgi:hypothetical protein